MSLVPPRQFQATPLNTPMGHGATTANLKNGVGDLWDELRAQPEETCSGRNVVQPQTPVVAATGPQTPVVAAAGPTAPPTAGAANRWASSGEPPSNQQVVVVPPVRPPPGLPQPQMFR